MATFSLLPDGRLSIGPDYKLENEKISDLIKILSEKTKLPLEAMLENVRVEFLPKGKKLLPWRVHLQFSKNGNRYFRVYIETGERFGLKLWNGINRNEKEKHESISLGTLVEYIPKIVEHMK